jgi:hypothetical protein
LTPQRETAHAQAAARTAQHQSLANADASATGWHGASSTDRSTTNGREHCGVSRSAAGSQPPGASGQVSNIACGFKSRSGTAQRHTRSAHRADCTAHHQPLTRQHGEGGHGATTDTQTSHHRYAHHTWSQTLPEDRQKVTSTPGSERMSPTCAADGPLHRTLRNDTCAGGTRHSASPTADPWDS